MIVEELFKQYLDVCAKLQKQPLENVLLVSLGEQKLYHYDHNSLFREYIISSGLYTPSCLENSLGTPWGLHQIYGKLGQGAPEGSVFKSRKLFANHYSQCSGEDQRRNLVTTRILRLKGLEPGLNAGVGCDSYDRYIYIHGTNHENKLGQPASAGCIQMSNREVIELFDSVPDQSHVWIVRE